VAKVSVPLSKRKVASVLAHNRIEPANHALHGLLEVGDLQGLPQRIRLVLRERVEVGAHRALEHDRLLRNDGQTLAQVGETERLHVGAVDQDRAALE
jgi:hypothetical protein